MASFFVHRPVVAIVISILMTVMGLVAMVQLPVAQFPNLAPPEIQLQATYLGADALTLEQSVSTPIEQQMNGVDNMLYMYSVNGSNGQTTLRVNFDVATKPNEDQILSQMRYSQAEPQLPQEVRNYGVTVKKASTSPLALFSVYSPNGTYDNIWLANYANININDPMSRVPGVGQVTIFGAGQYAMRFWVRPDVLAKLGITVTEILDAVKKQNTVNPAGQVGAEPVPVGQEFTYSVRAQGRLLTQDEFESIIVRANTDGSLVRLKDVARVELGAQSYNMIGRMNGKPAAIVAIYQLPGSNAIQTMDRATQLMEDLKQHFPADLDYVTSLDTTLSVREGINEILHTLWEALFLVMIVVFLFLQSWRATLIPLLAVPVSLVGTFMLFPLLGFSINTLSLFGLVLAIGLVVDDAIVVVEAVQHHIAQGLGPKEATLKAMQQVSGPVMAIALILVAVFVPTAFIPGITGRLYQQFAITIAVSVLISAFNALTLSPALAALLLRSETPSSGRLGRFFGWFNQMFGRGTQWYVRISGSLIRKAAFSMLCLLFAAIAAGWFGSRLPSGFLPMEDQGFLYLNVQLPTAASLQRTDEVSKQIEAILKDTPGVRYATSVVGFSLLSSVNTTYNAFLFVTLAPWEERRTPEENILSIYRKVSEKLGALSEAEAFLFPPPAIPGVGSSGGVSFILEDRSGQDVGFLAQQTDVFMDAARKRPEIARVNTTFIPSVPQLFAKVDREKTLKQGVNLSDVYQTLQAFMGGVMVNYFNRFGRVWQVYVQADGEYRTHPEHVGQFYVRNASGNMVPMSTLVSMEATDGPEFTMRYNGYRSAQLFVAGAPGFSSAQVMQALEEVFKQTMLSGMGYDYIGMSFQEKVAAEGVPASIIFGFSFLFVFLILAAQYESWTLPFSVLLVTPIAVFGAFGTLWLFSLIAPQASENDVFVQIGLVMLIGLSAKNAILIVQFAKEMRAEGMSIAEAALEAARLRLRPILMTAFAFILGVVPLILSSGAGAHARILLGLAVFGGMTAASSFAIFLIPASFYVVESLVDRVERLRRRTPSSPGTPKDRGFPDLLPSPSTAALGPVQRALNMHNLLVIVLVSCSVSGCLMGPDYHRPPTAEAESWRVSPATSGSIANLPWWELLKDESLQQLIMTALRENLDLQIAAANINEYEAQLTIAKYDLIPSLSYTGSAFGFRNTNTSSLPIPGGGAVPTSQRDGISLGFTSASMGLKWELDLWGRMRRSVEAARAQLLSKQENQRVVILSLVGKVAESYFDLRALDYQIDITKRTLKAWDESVRLSKLRYQHGDIPKLDLDRFIAERANAAAQLADLEQEVVQRENQISVLLGHQPAAIPRGRTLTDQPIPPDVPPGLPSELLHRRPDIMKAEQDLVAATASIGVAQAMRFPQLALTGQAGAAQLNLSGASASPFGTFAAGATLTGPIYNASALGYQVKVSEAQGNQAIAEYQKIILQAFQEVEDALISVQKSGEKRSAQEEQVAALRASLRLAGLRYQAGNSSYLDLLTAQRALFDAELGLASTRRNQLVSVVKLYKALGGGWSSKQAEEHKPS